jgi:hypothetical protein
VLLEAAIDQQCSISPSFCSEMNLRVLNMVFTCLALKPAAYRVCVLLPAATSSGMQRSSRWP